MRGGPVRLDVVVEPHRCTLCTKVMRVLQCDAVPDGASTLLVNLTWVCGNCGHAAPADELPGELVVEAGRPVDEQVRITALPPVRGSG